MAHCKNNYVEVLNLNEYPLISLVGLTLCSVCHVTPCDRKFPQPTPPVYCFRNFLTQHSTKVEDRLLQYSNIWCNLGRIVFDYKTKEVFAR